MSNIKNTINKDASNINMINKNMVVFLFKDFQLDIIAIGIISVVSNTKYIESPSTPK